jgi:hypothetical protein
VNDLIKNIAGELKTLAITAAKDEAAAFTEDASAFLDRTKGDLCEWTTQLKNGEIDEDDFRWLLKMKKDVAEMQALKQKGIAKIRLEELQSKMLDAVAGAVLKAAIPI